MKESFKDQFRDFVQQQGINFDELSDTSRSKQMARFFAVRILGPLNPTLIPEDAEEFEACVIDGKDDSGIDLLVVDEQSVVVVQAKYAGAKKQSRKPSEEKADFDRFLTVLKRMVEGPKIHAMNQKLREALAEVDFENANFQLSTSPCDRYRTISASLQIVALNPYRAFPTFTSARQLNCSTRKALTSDCVML